MHFRFRIIHVCLFVCVVYAWARCAVLCVSVTFLTAFIRSFALHNKKGTGKQLGFRCSFCCISLLLLMLCQHISDLVLNKRMRTPTLFRVNKRVSVARSIANRFSQAFRPATENDDVKSLNVSSIWKSTIEDNNKSSPLRSNSIKSNGKAPHFKTVLQLESDTQNKNLGFLKHCFMMKLDYEMVYVSGRTPFSNENDSLKDGNVIVRILCVVRFG